MSLSFRRFDCRSCLHRPWRVLAMHLGTLDFPATLLAAGLAFVCDTGIGWMTSGAWLGGVGITLVVAVVPSFVRLPCPGPWWPALLARLTRGRLTLALVAAALCLPGTPFGLPMAPGLGPLLFPDWHGEADNCLYTMPLAAVALFLVVAVQGALVALGAVRWDEVFPESSEQDPAAEAPR